MVLSVIYSPSKHDRRRSRRLAFAAGTMGPRCRCLFIEPHAANMLDAAAADAACVVGQTSNSVLMRLQVGFRDFRGTRLLIGRSPICPNYGIDYTPLVLAVDKSSQNNTMATAKDQQQTIGLIDIITCVCQNRIRGAIKKSRTRG